MTSSYLLSKRYPKKCTSWDAYQTFDRFCPEGYNTYHQGKHGWKVCSLQYEKDGTTWQDGSGNKYGNACPGPKNGMLPFQATLYDPRDCPHGMYETIPYELRIRRFNLHEPRSDLDRLDYLQLPMEYNGTGYKNLRAKYDVQNQYGKLPQFADDDVTYPPVSDETQPISQPYLINEMAKQSRDEGWSTLTSRMDSEMGGFYGEPVSVYQRGW